LPRVMSAYALKHGAAMPPPPRKAKLAAPPAKKGPPPKPAETVPPEPSGLGKYASMARAKLNRIIVGEPEREFFSTGDKLIDEIFGIPRKGLFTGGMVELRGDSQAGKSLLGAEVAARCLKLGAIVHWVDVEASWSNEWMGARGLDRENVNLFQPFLGLFTPPVKKGFRKPGIVPNDEDPKINKRNILKMLADPKQRALLLDVMGRIETAEEIIEDVELAMKMAHGEHPDKFQILVVDSVAALVTDEELTTDLSEHTMRTNMALTMLLRQVLKRWMGFLPQYRVYALLLNQIRENPMLKTFDKTYSPGGRPIKFYPQIRLDMSRKTGFLTQNGVTIGIHGRLKTFKNKADGREGRVVAYKLPYRRAGYLEDVKE